jgi:hypothetical protein
VEKYSTDNIVEPNRQATDNIVEPNRHATDNNKIWRMRIACWIFKAIDTNSEYVIFIAFSLQQCLQERA